MEDSATASTSGSRQIYNSSSHKNITRLTIRKKYQVTPPSKDSDAQDLEVEVASLSREQPRLTRVANGIKMEGVLERRRAVLTLEMVKSTDCRAEFSCQVRSVDANGEESVSLSRVHQGRSRSPGMTNDRLMSPVSLQVLDLVHQLDTKLTLMSKFVERIESKMNALENNLNIRLALVGKSTEQIQSETEALSGHVVSLQNRLEDKLEDGVEDKIAQVHMAVLALTNNVETYSKDVSKSLKKSFTTLSRNLKNNQEATLINFNSALQNILEIQNNATGTLLSSARNMTQTQTMLRNEILKNVEQAVDKLSENKTNMSKIVTEEFASLAQDLLDNLQHLAADVNRSAIDHHTLARDFFDQSTVTAVVKDLFVPKRCTSVVAAVSIRESYPYPLIQPRDDSIAKLPFLCDTVTDGGGWIVIQRRSKGDVDFFRGWEDYKNGFGHLTGDFWLGNEKIHKITTSGPYELRVELVYKRKSVYAQYGRFSIGDERSGYALTVGEYRGTAGNSLWRNNGRKFSTRDRDNDISSSHCAKIHQGAWWYWNCTYSSLNGKWQGSADEGPFWRELSGHDCVSFTEMKIRHL